LTIYIVQYTIQYCAYTIDFRDMRNAREFDMKYMKNSKIK